MNEQPPEGRHARDVSDVLRALGSAQPGSGFEQRVLNRIADAPAPRLHSNFALWAARLRSPRFGIAAGLTTCALCAALLLPHRTARQALTVGKTDAVSAQRNAKLEASRTAHGLRPPAKRATPEHPRALATQSGPASPLTRQVLGSRAKDRTAMPPKGGAAIREASFPAPDEPLTEQERLLLRIAHRKDAMQMAMLDPVERDLQRARERAEATRFFAPPPLPKEVQQQIKAALRSQYVNTPPPDELN